MAIDNKLPVVDTFLFTSKRGTFRLHEFMAHHRDEALRLIPGEAFRLGRSSKAPSFFCDFNNFAYEDSRGVPKKGSGARGVMRTFSNYHPQEWHENQAPFTFCTAVLSESDLQKLSKNLPTTAREVASISAKLTLDNRFTDGFTRLSESYMQKSFGFQSARGTLINRSHDDTLFFTFSRRGAVAFTSRPNQLPALFVVPSLLNLFEILRARVLGGIVVGSRLARMAETLARLDPILDESPDAMEYARLRMLVVQNLQNPLEYLFDGGSATDLAMEAEEMLFAGDVWRNVRHSFDVVDRLMSAWDAEEFRLKYS